MELSPCPWGFSTHVTSAKYKMTMRKKPHHYTESSQLSGIRSGTRLFTVCSPPLSSISHSIVVFQLVIGFHCVSPPLPVALPTLPKVSTGGLHIIASQQCLFAKEAAAGSVPTKAACDCSAGEQRTTLVMRHLRAAVSPRIPTSRWHGRPLPTHFFTWRSWGHRVPTFHRLLQMEKLVPVRPASAYTYLPTVLVNHLAKAMDRVEGPCFFVFFVSNQDCFIESLTWWQMYIADNIADTLDVAGANAQMK